MEEKFDSISPLMDVSGYKVVQKLREHAHAPRFTHQSYDRLTAEGLLRVQAFEKELKTIPPGWLPGEIPAWLAEFAERCYEDVPFYRRYGVYPAGFSSIPTSNRADLGREPWAFVPDGLPIDEMAVYQTSGTTGHPINILTHPEPLSMYLPLIRAALSMRGVALEGGRGRVAIAQICFQKTTWTYATIFPFLEQAAMVKINLSPAEWRDPDDRWRYLDDCRPEIYTGDPISFLELMHLPLQTAPKALVSTSMALSPAFGQQLEDHFSCPVVDIYSMNESGPIAVHTGDGHQLLHHRLYMEILRTDGSPCPAGERGEIVLSGGFNPFLPLLRYRTGDFASLTYRGRLPVIVGLEGRPPVRFHAANGGFVNNIDVSNALKPFALPQYFLHQFADGSLRLSIPGLMRDQAGLAQTLARLFGDRQTITIETVDADPSLEGKVVQYTSDYPLGE